MNNHRITWIIFVMLIIMIFVRCLDNKKHPGTLTDSFPIYASKDTFIIQDNSYRQIQSVTKIIRIDQDKTLFEKLTVIADTLSKNYFNGLKIEISDYPDINGDSIIKINLIEDPDFKGPGTLSSYKTWYDYFQGTYGGQNTTIILRESLLQRDYNGVWIDGLVFFYQGEPIGNWDHIDLKGIIKR